MPNLPLGIPSEASFYNRKKELKKLKNDNSTGTK
jgi:hypothetical protein